MADQAVAGVMPWLNGTTPECPLCHSTDVKASRDAELRKETWDCTWCGRFQLWPPYSDGLFPPNSKPIIRGLIMERQSRKEDAFLVVRESTFEQLLAQGPRDPVEQADRLLLNLAARSSEIPIFTYLTSNRHQGLAFIAGNDAFVGWLGFLRDAGWIDLQGKREDKPNDLSFRLTLEGWRRVRELREKGHGTDTVFVAMPFKPEFDNLWKDLIEPAIRKAGWRPVRADKEQHSGKIDDWILNQLQSARAVVAETTDNNPGACFEAGYALGHRRPVVWLARRETVHSGLHFDIRQYNHVTWEPSRESASVANLAERILNTIGRGPIRDA